MEVEEVVEGWVLGLIVEVGELDRDGRLSGRRVLVRVAVSRGLIGVGDEMIEVVELESEEEETESWSSTIDKFSDSEDSISEIDTSGE